MKYYVYIIKRDKGFRYTGMTENLPKRLDEHNIKSKSFWTKRGTNWRVIYSEEFDNKTGALIREKWLKTGVGRDFLKNLGL